MVSLDAESCHGMSQQRHTSYEMKLPYSETQLKGQMQVVMFLLLIYMLMSGHDKFLVFNLATSSKI